MSVEHKKPLFAFILVAVVTAAIIGTSLRVEALRPLVVAGVPITVPGLDADGRLFEALGLAPDEDEPATRHRRHGDRDGARQAEELDAPDGQVIVADPLPRSVTTGTRAKSHAPRHEGGHAADEQSAPPEKPHRQHDAGSTHQSAQPTPSPTPAEHGTAGESAEGTGSTGQTGTSHGSSGGAGPKSHDDPVTPDPPVPAQPSRPPQHTDPEPTATQHDATTEAAIARARKAATKMISRGPDDLARVTQGVHADIRTVTGRVQEIVTKVQTPGGGSVSRGLHDLAGLADVPTDAAEDLLGKTVGHPAFGPRGR